jgi:CRISPR-associated endoribonuclease Cas6
MRLNLHTSNNDLTIPFNYQQKLTGVLHKWLGENNNEHGETSLYSFSWLRNTQKRGNGLICAKGASLFLSFHDTKPLKNVLSSIRTQPEMFCGMVVEDVTIEEDPDLTYQEHFNIASPILIKRPSESGTTEYLFDNPDCGKLMEETLRTKMKITGLPDDETLHIEFDLSYAKKKTKLVWYGDISNRANICPVIIQGTNLTKQFAWNVGLGNCTGIGFGSIY